MPSQDDYQRSVNKYCARAIPAIILGVTGYGVYVVVDLVIVRYLLRDLPKSPNRPDDFAVTKRPGIAIPYLIFFFLLLLIYLACYLRLLLTVIIEPGFTLRNPQETQLKGENAVEKSKKFLWACAPTTIKDETKSEAVLDRRAVRDGLIPAPSGIERFYNKDVWVCDTGGLPIFCDYCNNWKLDRTHHCSEVDRCVARMDHFCPWVGGVVSETNMKFFIQFTFYATLWSTYTGAFMIWAIVDRRGKLKTINGQNSIDGQWIATLAIAALLGVFIAGGMFFTTFYNAAMNKTTNESMFRRSYSLAVLVPRRALPPEGSVPQWPTITYPLRPNAMEPSADMDEEENRINGSGPRTFAILQTLPSDHIWDMGKTLENLKSVLGARYIDWILPLRQPPCTQHDDPISDYPLGPDFERLCREAGIPSPYQQYSHRRRRGRRRGRSSAQ